MTTRRYDLAENYSSESHVQGKWLPILYVFWFCLALLSVVTLIAAVPARFDQILNPTQAITDARLRVGLSNQLVATYSCVSEVAISPIYLLAGAILLWFKPRDRMALFASLMLTASSAAVAMPVLESLLANPVWQPIVFFVETLGFVSTIIFFYLFPNGRFAPQWTLILAVVLFMWAFTGLFSPVNSSIQPRTWPPLLWAAVVAGWFLTSVMAQLHRYVRQSNQIERQQTKWIVFGYTITTIVNMSLIVPYLILPPVSLPGPAHELYALVTHPFYFFFIPILIPISIAISIFRYHLWEIDVIINRTLVYGLLTTGLTSVYIAIVAGLGIVFQSEGSIVLTALATIIAALLFQPLRIWLQHSVNRLMYGERDDPYAVLSQLSQQLGSTLASHDILPTLVETIAKTLKLPYVAIQLKQDNVFTTITEYWNRNIHGYNQNIGQSSVLNNNIGDLHKIPLVYQSEIIGQLSTAFRSPGEVFTSKEQRLLIDIARQAGVSIHAVQLTAALQRSRENLVAAREEERRRLRRDLHDGLGPQLASQTLTLTAARQLLRTDPDGADSLLAEATRHAQSAIADIRRVVFNLRPPALDDLGLVNAIQAQTGQYGVSPIQFTIDIVEPIPVLPAAVEVACYRIVQEALTNVFKHSGARKCTVGMTFDNEVYLQVSDDGCGLPADRTNGIGLGSMRERAEELGGNFQVESGSEQGTKIIVRLPLPTPSKLSN